MHRLFYNTNEKFDSDKKKKNNFGHCENNVGDKPRVIRMIHFKRLLLFIIQQASNLLYDTVLLFFGGLKKKK